MGVGVDCVYSLWFLIPDCARSLLRSLCSLQSLCPVLSSGVNHNATAGGSFSHLRPLPAATPGVQYHRGLGSFGDSLYYPIQWVESKDGATRELIRGLGYSGSSLPSCPSLSLDNLLCMEDFPWSTHGVGMTWVQSGFTGLRPDV